MCHCVVTIIIVVQHFLQSFIIFPIQRYAVCVCTSTELQQQGMECLHSNIQSPIITEQCYTSLEVTEFDTDDLQVDDAYETQQLQIEQSGPDDALDGFDSDSSF